VSRIEFIDYKQFKKETTAILKINLFIFMITS